MSLEQVELVVFLFAVFANTTLAYFVWKYAVKNISRHVFIAFLVSQIFWISVNYLAFIVKEPEVFLWFARLTLFFAVLHIFFFTLFIYTFLQKRQYLKKKFLITTTTLTGSVAVLTLTPYVFSAVELNTLNQLSPISGPAIPLFGIFIAGMILFSVITLIKRYRKAEDIELAQWKDLSRGLSLTMALVFVFSFLSFVVLENVTTVRFGHLYTLPFVMYTTHAIVRHRLFNLKIVITELFVFLLWLFIFIRTILYNDIPDLIIGSVLFIVLVIVGTLLIQSVTKEVRQREQLQKLTDQLEYANDKLKDLDRLKTEFLSLASHQLRSPLTVIKGYSSMLLEGSYGKMTAKVKEPVERIYKSSENLTKIVNDLLDVSKIEQGGMKFVFEDLNVRSLTQSVADEMKLAAKKKGLKLIFKTGKEGSYMVKADSVKLRQVIANLTDNAIKYTEHGDVTLSVKEVGKNIRIMIEDSGMGIAPDDLKKLFGKFVRGKAGKSNTGGSGLGLYLAKEIVKAHGGKLWAKSPGVGKGSTFFVELSKE